MNTPEQRYIVFTFRGGYSRLADSNLTLRLRRPKLCPWLKLSKNDAGSTLSDAYDIPLRLDMIRLNWVERVGSLFQVRILEREARSASRDVVAATLTKLRDLEHALEREYGRKLFTSLGEGSLVVVADEDNYFGCLVFKRGLESIGFHVALLQPADFNRVGTPKTLYNIIYFVPLSKELIFKFPNAFSLYSIAAGDFDSWDALVKRLPELPRGADLWLRQYFQLAASHVRLPPEPLGATSGVTSYR